MLHLYMACEQVNIFHSDKQEEKTPDQQNKGAGVGKNRNDGGQDCDVRYEGPDTKVMQSGPMQE